MDGQLDNSSGGQEQRKIILVLLVGAPGSGKSTFCEDVMRCSSRPWVRVCQDTIGNGKAGTKLQCLASAASALKDGKSVFIDRCNLDREQRADFVKLGSPQVDVHAVVLDLPARVCIARSVKRTGHEGNLQGGKAAAVVNRMLQNKQFPKLSEGYHRVTFCQNESDVDAAVNIYGRLGPLDTLPSGYFGQKNPDLTTQLGIRKFLKKIDAPIHAEPNATRCQDSASPDITEENNQCSKVSDENQVAGSGANNVSVENIPTLAFPSFSTADFQFNHEKASDIIIEKVQEFVKKVENARLVLVDLSHGSKILSLVRSKAAKANIDPNRFFTFVGDITRLHSVGGLCCNVIANAANWRLKPGGGGVNAAIFSSAGPALEVATKERAGSLQPGKAVVVPLPRTSPLFSREGVTHVIHVLGPNMNPQRPNCLDNNYSTGCRILREAYSSLFEGFTSVLGILGNSHEGSEGKDGSSTLQNHFNTDCRGHFLKNNQKSKREGFSVSDQNKKLKDSEDDFGANISNQREGKETSDHAKTWSSWAQALYHFAMHPERHKNDVLEISDDVVILNDLYPKARKHVLVVARSKSLDCLADVRKDHLPLLKIMHAVGLKWAEKFLLEDVSLIFRLGYHSAPSMRQLHLHIISQDYDSKHLKNKKHWNSFNTAFFRDSVEVMEEVADHGKAVLRDDKSLLSMELRCHRCRSVHPNVPRLKSHIGNCRAPFPASLLNNGLLVMTSS